MFKMDTSLIPQVLNDFNAYDGDGDKEIGLTDEMTMADIVSKTVELGGNGTAGPMEAVVIGQYNTITQEIPLKTPYSKLMKYLDNRKGITINIRGAVQVEDRGTGETSFVGFRYMVMGKVKQLSPGNVKAGETFGSKITMTVNRLLIALNGEDVLEIDKPNGKVVVNGVDIMQKVRKLC